MRYIEEIRFKQGWRRIRALDRWSSYPATAWGKRGFDYDWLLPHPLYEALGSDADSRRQAYRRLFRAPERAPRGTLTQGATEEKQATPICFYRNRKDATYWLTCRSKNKSPNPPA